MGSSRESTTAVREIAVLTATLLSAAVAAGCGSSLTSTQPTPVKCSVSVSVPDAAIGATGGSGRAQVTAERECTWSARADAGWISITSGENGQGDGVITYQVAANPAPSPRTASISINGRRALIRQDPAACRFTIDRSSATVSAAGASGSISVATIAGCEWTASTEVPWITIQAGSASNGPGAARFTVAPNTGSRRTGTLTVAGLPFTVVQEGAGAPPPPPPPCSYAIAPTTASAPATGSAVSVAVTTSAGCTWVATSQASWITFLSGASATGSGSVLVAAGANLDPHARSGTATIAGQLFTLQQAGLTEPPPPTQPPSCSYALDRSGATVPLLGGLVTVAVATSTGCAWTATSHANWITVTAGDSGTGSSQVQLLVAPLLLGSRTGTVEIAGQLFAVTQSGLLAAPGVAAVREPAPSAATR